MSQLLGERLRQARRQHFVGREEEQRLFCEAVHAEALPFHVLYVHGPGGVGKSALLRAFADLCEGGTCASWHANGQRDGQRGGEAASFPSVPAHYLDARDLEPTAAALGQAVQRAMGEAPEEREDRFVLMIDTFEAVAPLQRWVREDFLPQLPASALLVLAGRQPPPPAWRADAGLQTLMRVLPLRNLPPEATRRYLARRGVPEDQHQAVRTFAHGHPLALSLVADRFDQEPEHTFAPDEAPDLVGALLRRFIEAVPSPRHRRALAACALVRTLSEALLGDLLDASAEAASGERPRPAPADAHELFEWLRTLSFIDAGPRGLFPHDLAREVLAADLRWRRPETHEALHSTARRFYTHRLREDNAHDYERILSDYLFLHRQNPVVKPLFSRLRAQWRERSLSAGPPREGDWPALADMTRRHEGEASAALLEYWKERPAASTLVVRGEDGAPAGFSLSVALHRVAEENRERDPAVAAAMRYLEENASLRADEAATLFRFWMGRDQYQELSPVQSLLSARRVRHYLTTPQLAFSFVACANPGAWELIFAYAGIERLSEAGFSSGEQEFALFGHDWRATPPAAWLEQMAERDITAQPSGKVPPAPSAQRLVLSEEDFAAAVKRALKDFTRPDRLCENPLVQAPLTVEAAGPEADAADRADALRRLLHEAAEQLEGDPRDAKFYRALHATYLEPAGTQEQAAEELGVPFSTFRRHLRRGIEHITEALWQRETGGDAAGNTLEARL